jgi:hypothetical protein
MDSSHNLAMMRYSVDEMIDCDRIRTVQPPCIRQPRPRDVDAVAGSQQSYQRGWTGEVAQACRMEVTSGELGLL